MHTFFLAAAILGSLYIFCVPRRLDLFTCAHLAALLYFMPGFFGIVHPPNPMKLPITEPIHETTYLVMAVVLIGILIGAIFSDLLLPPRAQSTPSLPPLPLHYAAIVPTLIGFAGMLMTLGVRLLLSPDKSEIMIALEGNRWYILCMVGVAIVAVYSFMSRSWICFGLAMSILLFDLFVGFRSNFVFTAGAVMLVWAKDRGTIRLIPQKLGYIVGIMAFTYLVLLYKGIYVLIKAGRWDLLASRLTSLDYYINALVNNEPSLIQAILNRTISTNYHTDVGQLYDLVLLPILARQELFGALSFEIGTRFDPQIHLFPGVDYGVAWSIWAQMWSIGGTGAVIIFVSVFILIAVVLNQWMLRGNSTTTGILALCGLIWVFYIHRNNIQFEGDLIKRYVIVFAGSWIWARLWVGQPAEPDRLIASSQNRRQSRLLKVGR